MTEEQRSKRAADALQKYHAIMADPIRAAEYKRKMAESRKAKYDEIMADPRKKAAYRAEFNARRRVLRQKNNTYWEERKRWLENLRKDPERYQEYLDKRNAYSRERYNAKEKSDPAYKARRRKTRAKFQSSKRHRDYMRNWVRNRRRTDPNYRLYGHLCSRVSALLGRRKNRKGTVELLGCSVPELKTHLERQWEPGMSWDNYGLGSGKWHIDLVRPCASFNLLDPEQANQCFHFSNMKPAWHIANCSKKSWYNGKHWFRKEHPRYSPEVCANVTQPACSPASEPALSAP
jgi:hypothetical protein